LYEDKSKEIEIGTPLASVDYLLSYSSYKCIPSSLPLNRVGLLWIKCVWIESLI